MLTDKQMKEAQDKDNAERKERVTKLKNSLHEFIILESTSLKATPEETTLAMLIETAASVCACASVRNDPAVAAHFLDVFEDLVGRGMLKMVTKILMMEAASDKKH